jgi:hypothetical protein
MSMGTLSDEKQNLPDEPRYLDFPHLPDNAMKNGEPVLNKYSSTLTKDHDFPGAQLSYRISNIRSSYSYGNRQCFMLPVSRVRKL